MEFQSLKYIYKSSGNPVAPTLLLLHGTGGNEQDLLPLAKDLETDFNILSVRGNISENGMPRFFKRLGMGIFDEEDLEFRAQELIWFVKETAEKEGFDASKVVALGYSNGANIAGAALYLQPDFLSGAVLFRPMAPFKTRKPLQKANNVPVFLTSGKNDPTVNPNDTERYLDILKETGFDVSHYNLNTSHNLTIDDVDLAKQWLQNSYKNSF